MRYLAVMLCVQLVFGCANTTFHQVSIDAEDGQTIQTGSENTGLIYYPPKQFVLVTRPLNKDGATTTKVISLPDKSKPMSMKFHPGFGSATVGVTLSNGMVTSFNQTVDTQLDELLANLTTPLTGLATADATKATAGLTKAQEDQIRAQISRDAAAAEAAEEGGQESGVSPPDPCSGDSDDWLDFLGAINRRLSNDQASRLWRSMNALACASIEARSMDLLETANSLGQSVEIIRLVATRDYLENSQAVLPLLALGKDPVAEPLRLSAKSFKEVKFEPEANETNLLAVKVREAANTVLSVANELDPPKPTKKSPAPFELFEIVMSDGGSVSLRKVEQAAEELFPHPIAIIED